MEAFNAELDAFIQRVREFAEAKSTETVPTQKAVLHQNRLDACALHPVEVFKSLPQASTLHYGIHFILSFVSRFAMRQNI